MRELDRSRRFCIVGGAGFIGSHIVDRLLTDASVRGVRVLDNFSSGRPWHLEQWSHEPRLEIVHSDASDLGEMIKGLSGCDVVIHLASNPDIARAVTEPTIDFDQGTRLTHHVLEAARRTSVHKFLYASGSGVYGDLGEYEVPEDHGPLIPNSTYGASKLSGEAMISAYCHMFGMSGAAFRFANVVGPRQTHGVGFDFIRRLLDDPRKLRILGDGQQSKSYIHVEDVVDAILLVSDHMPGIYEPFNVATGDYMTVSEIALMALSTLDIDPSSTKMEYTGGKRGWKGDVPVVRLGTQRIRELGWRNGRSTREAVRDALAAIAREAKSGRYG